MWLFSADAVPNLGHLWMFQDLGWWSAGTLTLKTVCRFVFFSPYFFAMVGSTAQMDDANRAMCYALRHPPARGAKPMKYKDIRKLVRKTDGRLPTIPSIHEAAVTWMDEKGQRGRPVGSCKTTKAEDKKILEVFHKLRPPGYGITSRELKIGLPKRISKKIGQKTIIRFYKVNMNKGLCQGRLISKLGAGCFVEFVFFCF